VIKMTNKKIIKNFSLHPLELSDELKKEFEVVEPDFNKGHLLIDMKKILNNQYTLVNEQHRIIGAISDANVIERGDIIYVAGMPVIILAVAIIAQIKGAKVVTGMLNMDTKQVIKIEDLLTYYKDLDRKFRYQVEYGKKFKGDNNE